MDGGLWSPHRHCTGNNVGGRLAVWACSTLARPQAARSVVAACLGHVGTCPLLCPSTDWAPCPGWSSQPRSCCLAAPNHRARPRVLGWYWGRVVEGECGSQALYPCYQWGECVSPVANTHRCKDSPRQLPGKLGPCPWGRTNVLVPCVVLEPPGSSLRGRSRQACWAAERYHHPGPRGASGLGDLLPSVRSLRPQPMARLALPSQLPPPCLALQPKKITLPS